MEKSNGGICLTTPSIQAAVAHDLYCEIGYRKKEQWISPIVPREQADNQRRPLLYLNIDGVNIDRWRLDAESALCSEITSEFGPGIRLTLPASAQILSSDAIAVSIQIECFDAFPGALVIQARFSAGGRGFRSRSGRVNLQLNNLLLDATRWGSGKPFEMWSYCGSGELREHALQALGPEYYKRNYLGVLESHDGGGSRPQYRHGTQPGFGGGIPLVDLWYRGLGIAVGHLEPAFKLCSIPLSVKENGLVSLGLVQHEWTGSKPQPMIESLRSVVILHEGDFFTPLAIYRRMQALLGSPFPDSAQAAHEPQWDTWGFGADYTQAEVLSVLPQLKEIGIHWITLDDRWFDATGDWQPGKQLFPGGEPEFKAFIDELHGQGFKVKLWTLPGEMDGDPDIPVWLQDHPQGSIESRKHPEHTRSTVYGEHPEWAVLNPGGQPELSKRANQFCCGAQPGVIEHFREITRKMFAEWGVDGLKQDAIYICPPCYAPDHQHASPDVAAERYGAIMQVIYETALKYNPDAVIMSCPCGTPHTPDWMRWQNQAITFDPWTSWVNRGNLKQLKALFGPEAAIIADHVEISDEGLDFSIIGAGGIPATRITPIGREKTYESGPRLPLEKKMALYKRWIALYRKLELSRGEYLNLYDFIYDVPETHVIRKDNKLYYAFFPGEPDGIVADQLKMYSEKKDTKRFQGTVELRGLDDGRSYRVYDYEHETDLGVISGARPSLDVDIDHHLLIEVSAVSS